MAKAKAKAKDPVVDTVKITAKVPGYTGESAGVHFRDGIGETSDPWRIRWFKDHGYVISADNTDADEAPDETAEEEKGDE